MFRPCAVFVHSFALGWRVLLPTVNLALFTLGLLAVRHRVLDEAARTSGSLPGG